MKKLRDFEYSAVNEMFPLNPSSQGFRRRDRKNITARETGGYQKKSRLSK